MKLLLTAPPDQCRAAPCFGLPVAHAVYQVGDRPRLSQASILVSMRDDLMAIDNTGFDGRGEAGPLYQEVLRGYMARGYDGALCDFEGHPSRTLAQAMCTLGELIKERGWSLYVTEAYASFSNSIVALIPSALSGGSLQQRLQEAVEHSGVAQVALAVEWAAGDFFLPSPIGQGISLTRGELHQRLEERAPSVFLSSELYVHCFIYMSRQNGAHFALLDDAGSAHKKPRVIRNLGISNAVLAYPQVDDLLPELSK